MEPGHDGNVGRKCETDIEVLEYGEYQVYIRVFLKYMCMYIYIYIVIVKIDIYIIYIIYICIYIYMYIHVYVYIYINVYILTHKCINMYVHL